MTTQHDPITIRTVVLLTDGTEEVAWQDYPTLTEALDLLSNLACIALLRCGAANVTLTNPESVSYVKPNGVKVTSAIMHDLDQYGAP